MNAVVINLIHIREDTLFYSQMVLEKHNFGFLKEILFIQVVMTYPVNILTDIFSQVHLGQHSLKQPCQIFIYCHKSV